MRATTKTMKYINVQIENFEFDKEKLYRQAKSLLSLYRSVVWSVKKRACRMQQRISGSYGMELNTALLYLSDFAPTSKQMDFDAEVTSLFHSKWLLELIDIALTYVKDYPVYGEEFEQLIRLRFADETARTDAEVSEYLNLERSTFYQRKKEAILLLGISLWGFVLPITLQTYKRAVPLEVTEDYFFQMVMDEFKKS